MSNATEAFARVRIHAFLKNAGWNLTDGVSVLFRHALLADTLADYARCDRSGDPMAVIVTKRASIDPIAAQDRGHHYAEQLGVPFVFLSNGEEVRLLARDLPKVAIDRKGIDCDYQIECVDVPSGEVVRGRRRLLVEVITGACKTRMMLTRYSGRRRCGRFGSWSLQLPVEGRIRTLQTKCMFDL